MNNCKFVSTWGGRCQSEGGSLMSLVWNFPSEEKIWDGNRAQLFYPTHCCVSTFFLRLEQLVSKWVTSGRLPKKQTNVLLGIAQIAHVSLPESFDSVALSFFVCSLSFFVCHAMVTSTQELCHAFNNATHLQLIYFLIIVCQPGVRGSSPPPSHALWATFSMFRNDNVSFLVLLKTEWKC